MEGLGIFSSMFSFLRSSSFEGLGIWVETEDERCVWTWDLKSTSYNKVDLP